MATRALHSWAPATRGQGATSLLLAGWQSWLPAAGLLALSLAGYLRTLKPTFGWGDSSELATAIRFLGIGHSPGYPTFILLAHAFSWLPLGDFPHRLNLFNASCTALAVLLAYSIFFRLTRSRLAAFIAAAAFAFSATLWDTSAEIEVHSLHLCLVGGMVWFLLRWRDEKRDLFLYLAALLFGIGLTNHPLIALFLPAVLYLVIMERGWRFLLGRQTLRCLGLVLVALCLYLYLPWRAAHNPPPGVSNSHSLSQFIAQLTSPGSRSFMFSRPVGQVAFQIYLYPFRLLNEFGLAGLLLGLVGAGLLWQRDRRMFVIALLAMGATILYSANYAIFDIYQYYLQSYLLWALFIAFGVTWVFALGVKAIARIQGRADSLTPRRREALVWLLLLTLPFCQFTANLRRSDASRDYSAEDYARAVFAKIERNSVVFADWWSIAPLGYLKYVEGQRKDVTLVPALALPRPEDMDKFLERDYLKRFSAVYACEMITYQLPRLLKHYRVIREGPLLHVVVAPPDPRSLEVAAASLPERPKAGFGPSLELRDVRLAPKRAKQGSYLQLDYFWTADGSLPQLDTLTRVRNSKGETIWLDKSPLLQGLYPLSRLKPDRAVRESHAIYLDSDLAPGRYEITVKVRERGGKRQVLSPNPLPRQEASSCPTKTGKGELLVGRFELLARPRPPLPGTIQRLLTH